jgi:hypothetical protein
VISGQQLIAIDVISIIDRFCFGRHQPQTFAAFICGSILFYLPTFPNASIRAEKLMKADQLFRGNSSAVGTHL